MAAKSSLYRVSFRNNDQIYEIYAHEVSHGGLLGFVEVGKLVFGEKSSVVVDPAEEKLKALFDGVERFFIPVHAVLRIDEVRAQGPARITPVGEGGKIMPFPNFTLPPQH